MDPILTTLSFLHNRAQNQNNNLQNFNQMQQMPVQPQTVQFPTINSVFGR